MYNGSNWTTVANSTASTTTPLTGNLDIIPFTATPIFSAQSFSSFEMVLAGNVTSSSITGGTPGQLIQIALTQGSSTTTAPASAPTHSTATTGGSLPASTTYYAVCSYLFGTTESLPSAEGSQTTGSGATNSITWSCPVFAGVTTYKFYIGTGTGAENYWFASSSASYTQIGVPSTGTPGLPYSSSTYTAAWPANLIGPPPVATGIGATTALIALYDGTNWITVGASGSTYSSGNNGNGYWIKDPLNHYHMWNCGVTLGGGDTAVSFPVSFTSTAGLAPIPIVIAPTGNTGYVTLITGSITTSGFTLHQNNQTGLTVCWSADGY